MQNLLPNFRWPSSELLFAELGIHFGELGLSSAEPRLHATLHWPSLELLSIERSSLDLSLVELGFPLPEPLHLTQNRDRIAFSRTHILTVQCRISSRAPRAR